MSTLQEKFTQAPEIATGFPRNLAIIRPVAWIIAICAFAGIEYLLWGVGFPHDPKTAAWPLAGRLALSLGAGLLALADILLIGYVYADAKRRGMRQVMWTLLAIFIPDAIGIILYFLLREPLPTPCPRCGHLARGSFAFCPSCGSDLLHTCRICHRKIDASWMNCAHCGAPVQSQPRNAA
jgi:hypothetical protein